ncbi:type I phosphomannose isomerase catalytic subunit [Novosphingobium sp.]|uniref:type I phosphomannose isomerase catalytic subunit n=1 Tax=Novosphingobium sp. TaxID=1874826 RepID=UPI003B52DC48
MTNRPLYPLRFTPQFQYRLWGGRALGTFMDTDLPGDEPIGEAWILSDRDDFSSQIANGSLAGQTLGDLMKARKADVLGEHAKRFERFPLLLKFLDVEKMLSVQVHPRDDQTALIPAGDTGKTEAWIVLSAEKDARIYAGLNPGTTAKELRQLDAKNADTYLPHFTPEVGQAVMIEAGTVHSLGDGVMVFEVQENSDTTFRLFDWDHVDAKTGKPRELQVDKALAAIDFDQGAIKPLPAGAKAAREDLLANTHFHLVRWQQADDFTVGAPADPRVLVCAHGSGKVIAGDVKVSMKQGDVVLLPASLGAARFSPAAPVTLFEIAIPEAA